MKLELEMMEYNREHTGEWTGHFTVRNNKDVQILSFSVSCAGSDQGHQSRGWQQNITAEQALAKLFAKAKERLKSAAEAI